VCLCVARFKRVTNVLRWVDFEPEKKINNKFLGAFVKSRKAAISCVMSVRLSVCLNGTNRLPLDGLLMKFDIRVFFENVSRIFKCHSNLTSITGTLNKDKHIFLSNLAQLFVE
jgi:phosphoribosylformylglycinamidine (FGAM) synthase-like amidotransferase family enzyme